MNFNNIAEEPNFLQNVPITYVSPLYADMTTESI